MCLYIVIKSHLNALGQNLSWIKKGKDLLNSSEGQECQNDSRERHSSWVSCFRF